MLSQEPEILVRCFEYDLGARGVVYVSVPHPHYGHDLISCKNCGEIYCCSRESQAYKKSLDEQLQNMKCHKCNASLANNYFYYPNNFINLSGTVDSFDVNIAYTNPDKESFLKKFFSIEE